MTQCTFPDCHALAVAFRTADAEGEVESGGGDVSVEDCPEVRRMRARARVARKAEKSSTRMMARRTNAGTEPAAARPHTVAKARSLSNQARLRQLSTPRIQAKLEIGAVDDPLEHEADRVAERVMRMPDPALVVRASPQRISRKCTACEEEEKGKGANEARRSGGRRGRGAGRGA